MRVYHILATALLYLLTNLTAFGSNGIGEKLRSLGADCEYDGNGNLTGVFFSEPTFATANDLVDLTKEKHLVALAISGIDLGNDGLKHLAAMRTLEGLYASETKFTDTDVKYLAGLPSLKRLDLSNTSVTDDCVPKLAALKNLEQVDLSSTRVSVSGYRQLRQKRPELIVSEDWDYRAGVVHGRGVLDIDRATIFFDHVQGPKNGHFWGGGIIQISPPIDAKNDFTTGSRGGGSIGRASLSASLAFPNGIPTIHIGKHEVAIKNKGRNLIVDGQPFDITNEKLRLRISVDGVVKQIE